MRSSCLLSLACMPTVKMLFTLKSRRLGVYDFCQTLKVVGKAQATKSNLHNFRYRCLVVALIDVSEVLSQTLHACISYERKKNLKIV